MRLAPSLSSIYQHVACAICLHAIACRVAVRLAPSQRFMYVERALLPLFLLLRPPAAAPSTLVDAMPLREFAERAQAACALPPLVCRTLGC